MDEEWFDLVNEDGACVGRATRTACHSDPAKLHPVVHALVLDGEGRILLQKRSPDKDIQPDRWDTSVGGHLGAGESVEDALMREVREEIGIDTRRSDFTFCYRYVMRNAVESELVHTFLLHHEGPFTPQESEISALRFWTREEIGTAIGQGVFTPNFEDEYAHFTAWERAADAPPHAGGQRMRVILAQTAGFCMGVRRAMDITVNQAHKSNDRVYTYGPLIHNSQVVESLAEQGVVTVDDPAAVPPGEIVIRAHGIPLARRRMLEELGFTCIDATCPHVTASQNRIRAKSAEGYDIVLVGDRDHAEVVGLEGHASTPVHIVSRLEEAEALTLQRRFCVIAQTTFNLEEYRDICAVLSAKGPECVIYDSICRATEERQNEVRAMTRACAAIIVVGGKHSANTCRLAEISQACKVPTFFVETAAELDVDAIAGYDTVGVTAGASTPDYVIQDVLARLQGLGAVIESPCPASPCPDGAQP